jgi:hypothetical protein
VEEEMTVELRKVLKFLFLLLETQVHTKVAASITAIVEMARIGQVI